MKFIVVWENDIKETEKKRLRELIKKMIEEHQNRGFKRAWY